MADYILKDIDAEKWRRFKASCDLQGITIKEAFIELINVTIDECRGYLNYHKAEDHKPKKGGKKT